MESLIQLVADSFARHGLDPLPASGRQPVEPDPKPLPQSPETLPQHNFLKGPAEDPAP